MQEGKRKIEYNKHHGQSETKYNEYSEVACN